MAFGIIAAMKTAVLRLVHTDDYSRCSGDSTVVAENGDSRQCG